MVKNAYRISVAPNPISKMMEHVNFAQCTPNRHRTVNSVRLTHVRSMKFYYQMVLVQNALIILRLRKQRNINVLSYNVARENGRQKMGNVFPVMIIREHRMMELNVEETHANQHDRFFFKTVHVKHVKKIGRLRHQVKIHVYKTLVDLRKCFNKMDNVKVVHPSPRTKELVKIVLLTYVYQNGTELKKTVPVKNVTNIIVLLMIMIKNSGLSLME